MTLDPKAVAVTTSAGTGELPSAGCEPAMVAPSAAPSARKSAGRRNRAILLRAAFGRRNVRITGSLLTPSPFPGKRCAGPLLLRRELKVTGPDLGLTLHRQLGSGYLGFAKRVFYRIGRTNGVEMRLPFVKKRAKSGFSAPHATSASACKTPR